MNKNLSIKYDPIIKGFIANTIGALDESDIESWSETLLDEINKFSPNQKFTLLLNGIGYDPQTLQVHKKYSLFLKNNEIITSFCRAMAATHHDPQHIKEQHVLMNDVQGFFTELTEAYNWLRERKNR